MSRRYKHLFLLYHTLHTSLMNEAINRNPLRFRSFYLVLISFLSIANIMAKNSCRSQGVHNWFQYSQTLWKSILDFLIFKTSKLSICVYSNLENDLAAHIHNFTTLLRHPCDLDAYQRFCLFWDVLKDKCTNFTATALEAVRSRQVCRREILKALWWRAIDCKLIITSPCSAKQLM